MSHKVNLISRVACTAIILVVLFLYFVYHFPVDSNTDLIITYTTLLLVYSCVGIIAILMLRRKSYDILEPMNIVVFLYISIFAIRPMNDIINNDFYEFGVDTLGSSVIGSLIVIVSLLFFYVGYYYKIKGLSFEEKVNSEKNRDSQSTDWIINKSFIIWSISFVFSVINLTLSGHNLSYVLSFGSMTSGEEEITSGIAALTYFAYSMIGPWLYICVYSKSKILKVVLTFLMLSIYLIKGTRIVLLAMLMGGIVFYYLYNKRRPSFKSVIIGCITLVLFMSFIQISRNSVRYGQGISIDMICENIGVGNVFDSDMTTYKAFYCIIDTYPDKHDYTLGRAMILQTFTTLIPRSIWSDKPVAVIREVIENSVNSSAAKAGRAAPGIAEYYFEFGIIGCCICMFILGLLFKKWKTLFTNSKSIDDYILYSILYGLMFQLIIRTSTSASIYQYLFTVLPVIFIKKSIYLK